MQVLWIKLRDKSSWVFNCQNWVFYTGVRDFWGCVWRHNQPSHWQLTMSKLVVVLDTHLQQNQRSSWWPDVQNWIFLMGSRVWSGSWDISGTVHVFTKTWGYDDVLSRVCGDGSWRWMFYSFFLWSHRAVTVGDKLLMAFAREFPKCVETFTGVFNFLASLRVWKFEHVQRICTTNFHRVVTGVSNSLA